MIQPLSEAEAHNWPRRALVLHIRNLERETAGQRERLEAMRQSLEGGLAANAELRVQLERERERAKVWEERAYEV
jgi:hypothetical protein